MVGSYPNLGGKEAPFEDLSECYIGAFWTVLVDWGVFIHSWMRVNKPFIKNKKSKEWWWNTATTYKQLNSDYDFFEGLWLCMSSWISEYLIKKDGINEDLKQFKSPRSFS